MTEVTQKAELEIRGRKNQTLVVSPNNYITETAAKLSCCKSRGRIATIVFLCLLQLLVVAYFYVSSDNYTITHAYSWREALKQRFNNKTAASKFMDKILNLTNSAVAKLNGILTNVTVVRAGSMTASNLKPTMLPSTSSSTAQSVAPVESIISLCPAKPPDLQGRLPISFDKPPKTFEQIKLDNPLLTKGGHGKPPFCTARHKVAIVIPYRDRLEHLRYFAQFMHSTLQRQQLDYQIFIINQVGRGKFNRAKLMNVGFLEALKVYPFECFAFHDVDLILEDDRSLYWCSDRPRHLSAGVDKFRYHLPYLTCFGGATLISKQHFEIINGFSNNFWGWGGEDDDIYNRIKMEGLKIVRYPMQIARYKMIRHQRDKGNEANPKRFSMIQGTSSRYKKDGLNNITYKVFSVDFEPTYTNVTVDLFGPM